MIDFEKTADFLDFTQGNEVAMKGHKNDAERFAEDDFLFNFNFYHGAWAYMRNCYFMTGNYQIVNQRFPRFNFLRESYEDKP